MAITFFFNLRYARKASGANLCLTRASRNAHIIAFNAYQWPSYCSTLLKLHVNRGVKRGQFPVEYRSILLVQDGPLACVSYS